jgi:hypothetical protein
MNSKTVNPSLHHQVLQSLQLMKFLWGPILTPSNKIVNSDTNSLVPLPHNSYQTSQELSFPLRSSN